MKEVNEIPFGYLHMTMQATPRQMTTMMIIVNQTFNDAFKATWADYENCGYAMLGLLGPDNTLKVYVMCEDIPFDAEHLLLTIIPTGSENGQDTFEVERTMEKLPRKGEVVHFKSVPFKDLLDE
jgi:hypothetical protein